MPANTTYSQQRTIHSAFRHIMSTHENGTLSWEELAALSVRDIVTRFDSHLIVQLDELARAETLLAEADASRTLAEIRNDYSRLLQRERDETESELISTRELLTPVPAPVPEPAKTTTKATKATKTA